MTYDETMELARRLDLNYQAIVGVPIHAELLADLLWRALADAQDLEAVVAHGWARAREDAGLPPTEAPAEPPAPEPTPAPPQHPSPLQGALRLAEDQSCYRDDSGPVLPVLCHMGDGLALYARDPAWAEAELDAIAAAGYHGVRTWTWLDGEYWISKGRDVTPHRTLDYWGAVASFTAALRARGLRWLVSQGDMLRFAAVRRVFMEQLADALRDAGELDVVCGVDAGNETWQNGERDPSRLHDAVKAFRARLDVPVWSLTSPSGEEKAELDEYSGSVYDVHGYRGGHAWDKIRHAFSIAYEGRPARRLGIQSEPAGPGPLVSVTEHQEELDAEALALLAAMHLLSRQATVFFSSPGVSCRERGEFARQPGFAEVPATARALPRDLMTFQALYHGGERWRGTRVLAVPEGSDLRCDHAIAADGRFVCLVYGPPGRYAVTLERAAETRVLDPGTAATIEDWTYLSGDRLVLEFTRGRVVIGRLR